MTGSPAASLLQTTGLASPASSSRKQPAEASAGRRSFIAYSRALAEPSTGARSAKNTALRVHSSTTASACGAVVRALWLSFGERLRRGKEACNRRYLTLSLKYLAYI